MTSRRGPQGESAVLNVVLFLSEEASYFGLAYLRLKDRVNSFFPGLCI